MHARIDELLSLRDAQPVSAEVAAHVRECKRCAAELDSLRSLRVRMGTLAQIEASAAAWAAIQARLAAPPASASASGRAKSTTRAAMLAAASVACIAVLISLRGSQDPSNDTEVSPAQAEAALSATRASDLQVLIERSRALEDYLRALPARPQVERVSTAAMLDSIEHRIQLLDYQLLHAHTAGLSDEQAQRLWHERVELMDSLVTVRYAEAGRTWF